MRIDEKNWWQSKLFSHFIIFTWAFKLFSNFLAGLFHLVKKCVSNHNQLYLKLLCSFKQILSIKINLWINLPLRSSIIQEPFWCRSAFFKELHWWQLFIWQPPGTFSHIVSDYSSLIPPCSFPVGLWPRVAFDMSAGRTYYQLFF